MVTNTNFDENENPTFIDGCNINGKQGIYVKGKDVIHLDAPEICFPEDAPLDTDKRELYSILNELFQDGGGGGDDDWQPPDDWLPVPEPDEYDIYMLVEVIKENQSFEIRMALMSDDPRYQSVINYTGWGPLTCDWGDGTVLSAQGGDVETYLDTGEYVGDTSWAANGKSIYSHTYSDTGQYVIHFTCTAYSNFFNLCYGYNTVRPLIAKFGSKIMLTGYPDYSDLNNDAFYNWSSLCYAKFNGAYGVPKNNFYGNVCLKKLDTTTPITGFYSNNYIFYNCASLSNFDFTSIEVLEHSIYNCGIRELDLPKCTRVSSTYSIANGCYRLKSVNIPVFAGTLPPSAFQGNYNLESVNIPQCSGVENYAFAQCRRLKKVSFPNCTAIEKGAFNQCFGLEEVYLPNCTSVGEEAFNECYNLNKITLADGCVFGKNSFAKCYSLYPRPDGSVN